jgi:hypothetical protein
MKKPADNDLGEEEKLPNTLKHARPKQILSNTDSHGGRGQFVACMHAHSHLHDVLFLCTSFESS